MSLRVLLAVVVLLFPASEVALALLRRARARVVRRADEGSTGMLWLVILTSVALAIASTWVRSMRIPGPRWLLGSLALLLLLAGMGLRWLAIITLGRFFTVDVAIHEGHVLVDRGPYRYLRHPAYTGLLVAFAGLGLSFGNLLSVCALVLPITAAILARIRKEEAALLEALGPSYAEYCARTKRLLPGVF